MDDVIIARWSPYVVGAGIGILSWVAFLLSNRPIGCSTAYVRSSGMIEKVFRGKKATQKAYYQEFTPTVDWEWMLVVGIVIGAFISSVLSGHFQVQWVPSKWAEVMGSAVSIRWVVALVGGIVMGFGARWAGGCTSGHGISGALQLAVSSWLVFLCLFISGIITAHVLFAGWGG
ncbi:YeeE/YedE family protein [Candidatus Aerophobetes bacterium]|nr:YeeE/YedE family protein [Candidatus Aerophobetes bacterium]